MTTIAIVGTGLIGTSLALAIKSSNLQVDVVGTDYDSTARSGAQKSGAFKKVEARLSSAIRGADVVVFAIPVMAMREMMESAAHDFQEGCVVTDVASSKRAVLQWAEEVLPKNVSFVGGHPMAGKEQSGPEHADGTMFKGKAYCIVPSPTADSEPACRPAAVGGAAFPVARGPCRRRTSGSGSDCRTAVTRERRSRRWTRRGHRPRHARALAPGSSSLNRRGRRCRRDGFVGGAVVARDDRVSS